jgi:tetratricopeptide (TPR) repeat protein
MLCATSARLIAGVIVLFGLLGCAAPQQKIALVALPIPLQVELSEVPFYTQEVHQCGPAALAMLLNAGGVEVMPQQLESQVYLPNREGSLQVEMLAATRRNGLLAYELQPELEAVLAEIAAGSPVLVLQNLAFSWYPVWHYAVVVGYDLHSEEIILRSGREQRQVMSIDHFASTWGHANNWAMVAVQPGSMPASATESAYVAAAVAFDKTAVSSHEALFSVALAHWPNNLTALIGGGNACYQQGEMVCAEKYYQQATLSHPDSAIAFNNLSLVLVEQQRFSEALRAINHAIALGGATSSAANDTLEQIITEMVR